MLFIGVAAGAGAQSGASAPGANLAETAIPMMAVVAVLLLASGLVSSAETAIFSLKKLDLVRARKRRTPSSRALMYLLERPNDTLTTILVVNNLVNVSLALTTGALTRLLFTGNAVWAFTAAALGATALILVFGEVVPKCLAHVKAPQVARVAAGPTAAISWALTPILRVMNAFVNRVFARLNIPESRLTEIITEEELKAMISGGEVSTVLEEDEREMIHGVFELGETFAEEIMVPRAEVAALPDTLDEAQMIQELRAASRNRIIIYHENVDSPVGYVLVKEVLLNPEREWRSSLRDLMAVPNRLRLFELLALFRRESTKIAVVVDEYGQTTGIVTLHDLLEEIVGDMTERHEQVEPDIRELDEGRWSVKGRTHLDDLSREIGVDFPDDLGHTIGGFVMNTLGRIPSAGAELHHTGAVIRVTRVVGRRIMEVEIARDGRGSSPQAARSAGPEATP